jgi:hypothetical protein
MRSGTMTTKEAFSTIFDQLRAILQQYEKRLIVEQNGAAGYSLNMPYAEKWQKELFFGAVQLKKNYVSYHLMPIYMYPDLLKGISPELKKHKQGKSCFNFKTSDKALFKELAQLTKQCVERCKEENLL